MRLRIQPKLFCNAWKQYGDYPQVQLPDGRTELALGDLVSGEERCIVLMLEVLPLPLLPDGSLPTSLEGEELVGLEFAYTSITVEGADLRLESRTSAHLVRIQGTQNPAEVSSNKPLTLGQLIDSLDEVKNLGGPQLDAGEPAWLRHGWVLHFNETNRACNPTEGSVPYRNFAHVSSEFYPDLARHYGRLIDRWVDAYALSEIDDEEVED